MTGETEKTDGVPPFRRSFLILLAGVAGIGCSPIFVRLSELDPTATAFHRVFLALPALWLWVGVERFAGWGRERPSKASDIALLVLAGLLFSGDLIFWHWSIRYTSVANAVLLANFTPIFVTGAAFLIWGTRFSPLFLLGVALAVAGAGLLMGDSLSIGRDHLRGDGFGLITAMFYAAYIVTVGRLRTRFSPAVVMGWSGLATAPVLLIASLVLGENLIALTLDGWLVLAGLALISHAAGQGLIAHALAHLPAPFTSVSLLLQPAIAIVLAWVILSEPLGPWQAAGVAVIAAGILCARLGER